jgi:hypothetical protein
VDADGYVTDVLCHRVKLENLADRFASDPYARPTCGLCLRALERRQLILDNAIPHEGG